MGTLEIEDTATTGATAIEREPTSYGLMVAGSSDRVTITQAATDNNVRQVGDVTYIASFVVGVGATRIYEITAPVIDFQVGQPSDVEVRWNGTVVQPSDVITATGGDTVPVPRLIDDTTNGDGTNGDDGSNGGDSGGDSGGMGAGTALILGIALLGD